MIKAATNGQKLPALLAMGKTLVLPDAQAR
jgi:hypothetical protein